MSLGIETVEQRQPRLRMTLNAEGRVTDLVRLAPRQFSGQVDVKGYRLGRMLDRRTARLINQSVLMGGDITAYLIAYNVLAAMGIVNPEWLRILVLVTLCSVALYWSEALYPGYLLHHHEQVRRRVTTTLKVGAVACLGATLLLGEWRLGVLAVEFVALALAIQPIIHHVLRSLIHRSGCWGETATIIAGPNRVPVLRDYFATNWQYGIRPAPLADAPTDVDDRLRGDSVPRIAMVAGDTIPSLDELETIRRGYAEVILLADTPNLKICGLRPADLNGQIGLRLGANNTPDAQNAVRRLLDLAVAIPAAVAFTPIMLLAGAAIYAVDPGPVIYRQAREGLKGRTLHVLKLRTMYKDAEQRLDALLSESPAAQAEWSAHFKLRNDPRTLPVVGSVLRSTSLDELPQLFNVIAGGMRIVGPRPFPDYHLSAMKTEFRTKRRSVTPGLTGLWQISERSEADINLQQQLDEFYIDNMSFWFDWYIILNTVSALFKRRGAY